MSANRQSSARQAAYRWHERDTTYWPSLHPTAESDCPMTASVSTHRRGRMSAGSQATHDTRIAGSQQTTMNDQAEKNACVLWVDAVGGFLLTAEDQVSLGQARPDKPADIMIQADLSGRHACIRREGEDYVIQPLAVVCINGQPIVKAQPISDGDIIGLGASVQLRFRKPHPLSNTALLEVISGQRFQPAVDAIILMGETCLLGPHSSNHVSCAHWDDKLVLSRADSGRLRFRAGQRVAIDGQDVGDKGEIAWGSRMSGTNFAISFERM